MEALAEAMEPHEVTRDDLPASLLQQYVASFYGRSNISRRNWTQLQAFYPRSAQIVGMKTIEKLLLPSIRHFVGLCRRHS